MARSKSGGKGKQTKRSKPARAPRTEEEKRRLRSLLSTLLTLGVIAGAVGAMALSVQRLEARASARSAPGQARPDVTLPSTILLPWHEPQLTWPPAPVLDRLEQDVHAFVEVSADPFSGDAVRRIANHLEASGLFKSPPRVRRGLGGAITVEGNWRPAVAAVRHMGMDQLVSPQGAVLPVAYDPEESDFRVILGAAFDPPLTNSGKVDYGEPWPGADVRDALTLLAMLRTRPYWPQVRGIDVSKHGLGRAIEIVTEQGRVVWGAPPGEFRPAEIPTQRKLEHLQALYDRYGRIDAGRERVVVMREFVNIDDRASGER